MKLVHNKIETAFNDDAVNILTIENPEFFREVYRDMCNVINGLDELWILSENDKCINIAKYAKLIVDPIMIDFCDKKANSRLLSELSELAENKYPNDVEKINRHFSALMNKLKSESSVDIDWYSDSPIQAMFKAFGVTVGDEKTEYIERLINYIDMFVCFYDIRLVVFVNLKSYFNSFELHELYKYFLYNHLLVIDFESCFHKKYDRELNIIIDDDLCEIIA